MKQCSKCKQLKEISEFNKSENSKDKKQGYCRDCNKKQLKEWMKNNPDFDLLYRYNITGEEKARMIKQQNNVCAICKNEFVNSNDKHVDHCHDSNKIRGVLCKHCNLGLGHFRDSPKLLQRAIFYLDYHANQKSTTPIPTGPNRARKNNPQLGFVFTAGPGENSDDANDYRGATQGENSYRSAKEGSGDSVGHRDAEVGAPQAPTDSQDPGHAESTVGSVEEFFERVRSKSRELDLAAGTASKIRQSGD